MAYKLSIPFYGFTIKLLSGQKFHFPLSDKQALRIKRPRQKLADAYTTALQKKIMDKGEFIELMDIIQSGDFSRHQVSIAFPASRDHIRYPSFSVEMEYFLSAKKKGYWGIIPTLGLEAFGNSPEDLSERLQEALQFEFTQQRRLSHVQRIVSALWFEDSDLIQDKIKLKAPSLREIDEDIEVQTDQLLPRIAQKVVINQQAAFGREQELKQLASILNGKYQNNALVVGPAGVGKTALVWELAYRKKILRLKGEIWETTASTMIKELTRDTGWQDNIEFLCKELTKSNDFLFVRNLMELFEVGKYEGNSVSIAEYLKTFIARGEISLISECTEEEKAKIELLAPNYLANFQIIAIEEPAKNLEDIIHKKVAALAKSNKIDITTAAIKEALRLNRRFSPYAGMPGKPIRFLEGILLNKQASADNQNSRLDQAEIIEHFCDDTGIPNFLVDPNIPMDVQLVRSQFKQKLFGQEQAIDQLTDVLAQVKTALTKTGKPIASFLFVGPTGVGKTALAKILAEFMFNSSENVVRFDMSEFSTPYDIIRLYGLGNQKDGLLTSAILKEPFSVILFDEIEKAHPNFYDLLLQILGEGRLSDSRGRLINFCSSIIIMTSNIGATKFQRGKIEYKPNKQQSEDSNQLFLSAVQEYFRPELFNRIDQVIPFLPLTKSQIKKVVTKEINALLEREGIRHRDVKINIDKNLYDLLVDKGYDKKYGARQLQRTIRDLLIIPLARELNQNVFDEQIIINIEVREDQILIQSKLNPLGFDLLIEELQLHTNTNHIGSIRRHCYRLKEGHFFNHLMSELDILNQQFNREKTSFWSDPQNQLRLNDLKSIRKRLEDITLKIESMEVDLGLSCMKLRSYTEEDKSYITSLENEYANLKQDIYSIGNPGSNDLILTIYSTNPGWYFNFYHQLLEAKQYQFETKGIWYSEDLATDQKVIKENEIIQSNRKGKKGFFKSTIEPEDYTNLGNKTFGSILCGLELNISGKCAALFFNGEEGFHQKVTPKEESDYAQIILGTSSNELPSTIHRKDYFVKQTMRRVIDFPTVKDNLYKINRESRKQDLIGLFLHFLESNFNRRLEREIV